MLSQQTSSKWFEIKDKSLIMLVLQSYADNDKKKILETSTTPRTILDIIKMSKLPQTSTYRKINSLIQSGLLVPYGTISMNYGKVVRKYISLFNALEINILKNDVSIKARINDDARRAILRMVREEIVKQSKPHNLTSTKISTYASNSPNKGTISVIEYLIKEKIISVKTDYKVNV